MQPAPHHGRLIPNYSLSMTFFLNADQEGSARISKEKKRAEARHQMRKDMVDRNESMAAFNAGRQMNPFLLPKKHSPAASNKHRHPILPCSTKWLPVDASRTKRKGDSNSPLKQKKKKPRFCTSRTSNINSTKNSKSRPSTVSSTKSNKRKGRKRQSQTTDALTDFDDTAAGFEAHVEHTIVNDNDDDFQPELVLRSKRKTQKLTKPKSSQGQEEVVLQQSASSSSNTITCISHEPDFALARRLSMIDPGSSSTPPSPNDINDGKVDRNVTGTSVKRSLVFIEDADAVFEQDKTFWAAISTLIETTKIPIILTCTINPISYDNECARPIATLEKHIAPLYVSRPSTLELASYVHLVCLAEGLWVDAESLVNLAKECHHDIHHSLMQIPWSWSSVGKFQLQPDATDSTDSGGKNVSVSRVCTDIRPETPTPRLSESHVELLERTAFVDAFVSSCTIRRFEIYVNPMYISLLVMNLP
ncbi:hypothetical protein SeMB42_g06452 [Synchytrium endobioticum]|uniref:ATPase AAA-type core domain-containing protein n=1 Tax=Synchytrium endobioticum TaxID=286115 RepID=A0A507CC82_9FUNG|nr:hypothetical protein SeMB42_g06452 [Synchytrium endobioticum]